jgi:pyruvate dehydrogenase E1 component alpha subunit
VRVAYRSDEEVEQWKQRDPIAIHKERLLSQGIATQSEVDGVDEEVKVLIDEAVEFARQSPYPDPSEVFDDLFANPIPLG